MYSASIQGTMPMDHLTDGLDGTAQLTDSAGAIAGAYAYDVFGSVRSHTGANTEWTFTGEQNDPTGLEYLRARYYEPALGRFLGRDPLPGTTTAPQSQNRYAYVSNNCPNYSDPSGLMLTGPGAPDAKQVCVSYVEVWDLFGRVDISLPLGLGHIKTPAMKLFRFELNVLYYKYGDDVYTHYMWADETFLGSGWHIDQSSLQFGSKEGGGAMASARFGAGGANPFGFWPVGFNTDVQLGQRIQDREIVGSQSAQHNPFQFPGIKAKSGMECGGWH